MPAKIFSASIFGFDCKLVEVEVDILNGIASIIIVGLGDAAVQEAKERIRSAIKNSGAEYPRRKKTINLAPADIPKHGPMFDLAIALGLLVQSEQIPSKLLEKTIVIGELALSGELRRTTGVLPFVAFGKQSGFIRAIVPLSNAEEASVVPGIEIIAASNLKMLIDHLREEKTISPYESCEKYEDESPQDFWRFEDIRGHEYAKRALAIAAAGGHNILMHGPPGSGKTILARSFQNVLPPLSFADAVEVTKIYSIAGKLPEGKSLIKNPPFRAVHHTASTISLVGGGTIPKPGEISLAHKGVLFLDELLEFSRITLDVLRQPIEDGVVHVSRVKGSTTFPSDFILMAATNPCPCGYFGDPIKQCICTPSNRKQYRKKLSGPLLDRIDIVCCVPRLPFEKITALPSSETSENIKIKIIETRLIQTKRFEQLGHYSISMNGKMTHGQIKKCCALSDSSFEMLKKAFTSLNCSGRAYFRILKVARTIADMENSPDIKTNHIAEALQYRPRFEND